MALKAKQKQNVRCSISTLGCNTELDNIRDDNVTLHRFREWYI